MTQSNKELFDRFSVYFLAVFISPILFGSVMALYSKLTIQEYWSFGDSVLSYSISSLPYFLLVVLPVSLYIDFSARTRELPHWAKALLLAGSAGVVALLHSLVLYSPHSTLFMFLFGMIGGMLHFALLTLLKKLIK